MQVAVTVIMVMTQATNSKDRKIGSGVSCVAVNKPSGFPQQVRFLSVGRWKIAWRGILD